MPFFTYILSGSKDSSFFIGVTQHLSNQLILHWYDHYESRSPSMRRYQLRWYDTHQRAVKAIQQARLLRKKTAAELSTFLAEQPESFLGKNGTLVEGCTPSPEQIFLAVEWGNNNKARRK